MVEEFFTEIIGFCQLAKTNNTRNGVLVGEIKSINEKQEELMSEIETLQLKNIALENTISQYEAFKNNTETQIAAILAGMSRVVNEPSLKLEGR